MPTNTTIMQKCGDLPVSIGLESYDVSDVLHRSPLAVIGRMLGGCGICGTLMTTDGSHQCLPNYGHLCAGCYGTYIEHWSVDRRSYILPDHPNHPYHKALTSPAEESESKR